MARDRRSRQADDFAEQARAKLPEPGDDPISHLRHTLAGFKDSQDDGMPISCTYNNIYGDGVRTGLTWGDLRAILAMLDAMPTGTEAHPVTGGARMHTMDMAGAFSDLIAELMDDTSEPQEARDAYHRGHRVPRGAHHTLRITASAETLYVFSAYAEQIVNPDDIRFDPSDSQIRGARKWLKHMSDRGL